MEFVSITEAMVVGEMDIHIPGVSNITIGDSHACKNNSDATHMALGIKVVRPEPIRVESPGVPNLVGSMVLETEVALHMSVDGEIAISKVNLEFVVESDSNVH